MNIFLYLLKDGLIKVRFSFVTLAENIMPRFKLHQSGKILGSNLMFKCCNQTWYPLTLVLTALCLYY